MEVAGSDGTSSTTEGAKQIARGKKEPCEEEEESEGKPFSFLFLNDFKASLTHKVVKKSQIRWLLQTIVSCKV